MCPDIPGAYLKLNDVEVAQDAPETEGLWNKTGANINQAIDDIAELETDVVALETSVATLVGSVVAMSTNATFTSPSIAFDGAFHTLLTLGSAIKAAWFNNSFYTASKVLLVSGQNQTFSVATFRISGNALQASITGGGSGTLSFDTMAIAYLP